MRNIKAIRRIALVIGVPLVLCVLAPEAVASGLVGTLPSLWATATALSLTLITVVSANRK